MVVAVILATVALASLLSGRADASQAVTAVYFVPRDQEPDLEFAAGLDDTLAGVQAWYGAQVGSTFALSPAALVTGQRDAADYGEGLEIWTSVLTELGYFCGTGVHIIFAHSSIAFNGGGYCGLTTGGTAYVYQGGFTTGGLAHELGHAFSLSHPDGCGIAVPWPDYCDDTVMWAHWLYPDVGLLSYEVLILQLHPSFDGPGSTVTPTPMPTPCEAKFNKHGKAIGAKRCR